MKQILINGDCLIEMPKLEASSIDLILTDLPYGITSNSWDSVLPIDTLWREFKRLLKPNGVVALTASQPFSSMLVMSNIPMFKHEWIWIKNAGSNFANTVREPFKEHEHILIFSEGNWTYNKQMQERTGAGLDRVKYNVKFESKSQNYREFEGRLENKQPELRVPSSWQKFNRETGLHPTQKPVALAEYLIKTYTNEGDTILDCCMGVGWTAIACKKWNRNFVGIEIDQSYFDTTRHRLSEVTAPLILNSTVSH